MSENKKVLIFGATGNVGGAAARELLKRGWRVRAITRNPSSEKAHALAELGAEIMQADMEDRDSLEAAFNGYRRVFSVQNWATSGVEGEIRQGKLVAQIAQSAEVDHLVYGSAGPGEPHTGVPHFENKLEIEAFMRALGIPLTIIRPGPFMELLSQKEFYPALAAWGTKPKVIGWDAPVPWVAVRDIGIAIANVFENPEAWIGRQVSLFGDVKTMAQCRDIFTEVDGRKPFRLSLPLWLFRRMASNEFIKMWQWMANSMEGPQALWETVESSRKLCPELLDLSSWLEMSRNGAAA